MKMSRSLVLSIATGICLGLCLSVSFGVYAVDAQNNKAQIDAAAADKKIPVVELKQFTHVIDQVKKYYVEDVNDVAIFENAVRGVLAGLDPHSAYLDAEEMRELQTNTSGKFGGLGIEVTMTDGFVKVVSPIDDTPASRANLMPGDLIIRIDETPVKGLSLAEAVNLMRGPKGSTVKLTIARENTPQPLVVALKRDTIQVKSVKSEMLEPGYGYIRISQFQEKTGEDVLHAVQSLEKENKGLLKGMILDLRNNPGGVLESSVSVSDVFLDSKKLGFDKLIVYTQGRMASAKMREYAKSDDALHGAPLVVLVNGGSASASEIVAGALQDHRRAIIMGSQTFGKGSVQTVIPLQKDTGIKLTTARYYTPSGRSIQAEGIKPDIALAQYQITRAEDPLASALSIREQDLSGHLANPTQEETPAADESDNSAPAKAEVNGTAKATDDYAKIEALNLLKGLVISRLQ